MNFFYSILIIILSIVICFSALVLFNYLYLRLVKKIKPIKSVNNHTVTKRHFLAKLFIDFPRALATDIIKRNPDEFKEHGIHCFCGSQGSGKTIALVELLCRLRQRYPQVKIATNFSYRYQDFPVLSWKDIVFKNNGIYGQVVALDEIQNWFSTNESRDFPPEMLQEICQQRKQRKMLACTSQRFERLAKPLREQITYLYKPITFLGCLTYVKVIRPVVDDEGTLTKASRTIKRYFFVHSQELRSCYDTYLKIARQANGGYVKSPLTSESPSSNVNVNFGAKKVGKDTFRFRKK